MHNTGKQGEPTKASKEGRTGAQLGFGNLIIIPIPEGLTEIRRQEKGKEEAGVGNTREADSVVSYN